MKSLLTLFYISLFSLNFAQTPKEEANKLGSNPIFFIDSIRVDGSDLQKYDPQEIASLTMYKDEEALKLFPQEGKDGVVYIQTKKFGRKRFENYFKTKSSEYQNLLSKGIDDTKIQYILNDKVLTTNFEGDLASINDNTFKALKVISKDELQRKFKVTDKDYGILITSDVPNNLYEGKQKFNK